MDTLFELPEIITLTGQAVSVDDPAQKTGSNGCSGGSGSSNGCSGGSGFADGLDLPE